MKYILQFSDWICYVYCIKDGREHFTAYPYQAKSFDTPEEARKWADENLIKPEEYQVQELATLAKTEML